jgi:dienelactone hydrolase
MVTLIVSDIFGHTANLDAFANELSGEVIICSPYEMEQLFAHQNEDDVYKQFINAVGHDVYLSKVQRAIKSAKPDLVIAFSAGASAAWRAVSKAGSFTPKKLIGFYPGQIRNYLNLHPRCHVELLFPHSEAHFELTPVISTLKKMPGVNCTRTRYNHGFMNALSKQFNKYAYLHYTHLCEQEIQTLQESLVRENLEVNL